MKRQRKPVISDTEGGEDRRYLFEVLHDAPLGHIEVLEYGFIGIKGHDDAYRYDPLKEKCYCPAGQRGKNCWHKAHIEALLLEDPELEFEVLSKAEQRLTDEELVALYGARKSNAT